jgi:hypothetical protein
MLNKRNTCRFAGANFLTYINRKQRPLLEIIRQEVLSYLSRRLQVKNRAVQREYFKIRKMCRTISEQN